MNERLPKVALQVLVPIATHKRIKNRAHECRVTISEYVRSVLDIDLKEKLLKPKDH